MCFEVKKNESTQATYKIAIHQEQRNIGKNKIEDCDFYENSSFPQCVDNYLQKEIGDKYGCLPPWMSKRYLIALKYKLDHFLKMIPTIE